MSSIHLSLSKKSNLKILQVTFCKIFLKKYLKNRNGLANNFFFVFNILKIVLKSGIQTRIM